MQYALRELQNVCSRTGVYSLENVLLSHLICETISICMVRTFTSYITNSRNYRWLYRYCRTIHRLTPYLRRFPCYNDHIAKSFSLSTQQIENLQLLLNSWRNMDTVLYYINSRTLKTQYNSLRTGILFMKCKANTILQHLSSRRRTSYNILARVPRSLALSTLFRMLSDPYILLPLIVMTRYSSIRWINK